MSGFFTNLAEFHFLRPLWFALAPFVIFLWWTVRRRATLQQEAPRVIAPHLSSALRVGDTDSRWFLPIDGVLLLTLLVTIALAGPTWSRVPNPLQAQTAPLVVALKVSASMEMRDIAPSRLERAKHKILDLLRTRAGARTALIAYAGTAHRVVPLSEDPAVLTPFLEGLSPAIMPRAGTNATAALALATAALEEEDMPGAILFVADAVDGADLPAFEEHMRQNDSALVFLPVSKERGALNNIAGLSGTTIVELTPDDKDVAAIERRVSQSFSEAMVGDDRQQWDDRGWVLLWPAAILALLWFRRGWTMQWSAVLLAFVLSSQSTPARADGVADWFFTADQQGRLAFDEKRFGEAADLFQDPEWKGYALYRAGRYDEAVDVLTRVDTARAAFTAGLAHLKSRGYRDAVRSFEAVLERDPLYPGAQRNLEIANAIVAYVERARLQSDTGEEGGVGADEIVYDNEASAGTETTLEATSGEAQTLSEEQWMRTVETATADFLKSRFLLEAAGGPQ